jgi:hypothetical protein
MADTGAPYFLPYPENTDLVRDGADAIKDLAEALAQALEDIPVTEKRIAAFTGDGTLDCACRSDLRHRPHARGRWRYRSGRLAVTAARRPLLSRRELCLRWQQGRRPRRYA